MVLTMNIDDIWNDANKTKKIRAEVPYWPEDISTLDINPIKYKRKINQKIYLVGISSENKVVLHRQYKNGFNWNWKNQDYVVLELCDDYSTESERFYDEDKIEVKGYEKISPYILLTTTKLSNLKYFYSEVLNANTK